MSESGPSHYPFTEPNGRIGRAACQDGYHLVLDDEDEKYALASYHFTVRMEEDSKKKKKPIVLFLREVHACPFFLRCSPAFPGSLQLFKQGCTEPLASTTYGDFLVVEQLPRCHASSPLSSGFFNKHLDNPGFYYLNLTPHDEDPSPSDHAEPVATDLPAKNYPKRSGRKKRILPATNMLNASVNLTYSVQVLVRARITPQSGYPVVIKNCFTYLAKQQYMTHTQAGITWTLARKEPTLLGEQERDTYCKNFGSRPTHCLQATGKLLLTSQTVQQLPTCSLDDVDPLAMEPHFRQGANAKMALALIAPVYCLYSVEPSKVLVGEYKLESQPCNPTGPGYFYDGKRFTHVIRVNLGYLETLSCHTPLRVPKSSLPLLAFLTTRIYLTPSTEEEQKLDPSIAPGYFVHPVPAVVRVIDLGRPV
jgi:hypothetical protein